MELFEIRTYSTAYSDSHVKTVTYSVPGPIIVATAFTTFVLIVAPLASKFGQWCLNWTIKGARASKDYVNWATRTIRKLMRGN
jgi:hypothetical protein